MNDKINNYEHIKKMHEDIEKEMEKEVPNPEAVKEMHAKMILQSLNIDIKSNQKPV